MIAGITVGLVLIPQALAYAQLAGMPPVTGLYAALMPGVVGALFGSSSLLAVGPVALTSLLTFAALQPLAEPGSSLWVSMAIWLAIYAGLIQLAMGALRMGAAANIISNAVVQGFINAAAVIIILSQLPSLIGFAEVPGDHWLLRMRYAWQVDSDRVLTTAAFGIGSLLTLLLGKSPSGKRYSSFDTTESIISALLAYYPGRPGISERTLWAKFSAAKRHVGD